MHFNGNELLRGMGGDVVAGVREWLLSSWYPSFDRGMEMGRVHAGLGRFARFLIFLTKLFYYLFLYNI